MKGYDHKIVLPGLTTDTLVSESGEVLIPPENWAFLRAGDAAITKSVKAKGEVWVVQVRKGRRLAVKSMEILQAYRQGREIAENCPLKKVLS